MKIESLNADPQFLQVMVVGRHGGGQRIAR
jgi:hypothetical protein